MIQKNMRISAGLILAAFVLRLIQVFALIDCKTGFYKRDYGFFGTFITLLVFALCAASAIISCKSLHIKKFETVKAMPVISGLTSIALLFELFVEKFAVQGVSWQVTFMKLLGFAAALYFGAFTVSKVIGFKMPNICHTIPALYLIMRIICSFINIASLSLIAENIFFISSLCCALLFFVSYAGFYCLDDHDKTFNLRTVLAFSVSFVTAASNICASIFLENGYNHIPFHSQFVLMLLSLFIGAFAFSGIFEKE